MKRNSHLVATMLLLLAALKIVFYPVSLPKKVPHGQKFAVFLNDGFGPQELRNVRAYRNSDNGFLITAPESLCKHCTWSVYADEKAQ